MRRGEVSLLSPLSLDRSGRVIINMCGIFGIISRRGADEVAGILTRAGLSLAHRGPDDAGQILFRDEPRGLTIGLAHRRLAVLDPSPAGHQPMADRGTGNWIVYNGEVFNHRALRRELGGEVDLHSATDTEVVLQGYGRSGRNWKQALHGWRGMFAFGLWNKAEGALHLVRDRLGIKPLYYYEGEGFLVFGSEVRSLLASGLVPARLSRPAVESFLARGSVEDPLTIIEGVRAVLPGHRLVYNGGNDGARSRGERIKVEAYWEPRAVTERGTGSAQRDLIAEVQELTREAVDLWSVSDVPISLFLSGGIDSSAIASLLQQVGRREVRSFAVGFGEKEFDERAEAELVARRYGMQHTTVVLSEREVLEKLPAALRAIDQPSIDGPNTWLVAGATAAAGMKVALSGLGGDEGFLGYRFYRTLERDERIRSWLRTLPPVGRRLAGSVVESLTGSRGGTRLVELLRSGDLEQPTVRLRRELFSPGQRARLLGDWPVESGRHGANWAATGVNEAEEWMWRQLRNNLGADRLNQATILELRGYLANTLLRDTDVMSMAHGLEVRVPLLDHRLIERLLRIDGRTRLGATGQTPKWLLVAAAGDLPVEVTGRRKKGFELPFRHWLRGPLRPLVEEALNSVALGGVLRREVMAGIWQDFLDGRTTWSRVWALVVLSRWIADHPGVTI